MAEVITVEFTQDSRPSYNARARYMNARNVMTVASGLLTEFKGN